VSVPNSGEEILRLAAVIDRQRRELDRLRSAAAARSVIDMAKGALIERLGCTAAEAASQLTALADEAGYPVAEIAAAIISEDLAGQPGEPADPGLPGAGTGSADAGPGADGEAARPEDARLRNQLAGAAIELAADGGEIAAAVLDQALAPLGAAAVALWLISADGSLDLLGEAGLGPAEASRWRRIPPHMDCPAQRVAHGGPDLWWPSGPPGDTPPDATRPSGPPSSLPGSTLPLIGRWPGGARATVALRDESSVLLGVMEVCWPQPRAGFPLSVRQQAADLAQACAELLGPRLARGDLANAGSRPAVRGLLDSLLETLLVASAVRDRDGRVMDFRIDYAGETLPDSAGRNASEVVGRTLLEAYPTAAAAGGALEHAIRALHTGQAQCLPGPIVSAPAGEATGAIAEVRIAPFFDGVVLTWRLGGEVDRLIARLRQIQRLGRIGAWEENLATGEVNWTESAFALFGLPTREGAAIPLADLHSYVTAADVPAVKQFRETLLRGQQPTNATFRIVRADDGSVRQMRVFAEPVLSPAGTIELIQGAFQDVSAEYQTQVALAATRDQLVDTEQRVAEEHLLAVRLQQAIMPPTAEPVAAAGIEVAVRYRPVGPGHLVGGDWYDTLLLPTQEVLMVVGDIAGHGIDAVTGMVIARNCLRGLAITGAGPAELLAYLNSAICQLIDGVVGTVVCGLYDPGRRVLRWARAGHLPPVVIRDGAAVTLPLPHGVLLGTDPDATYEEFTASLAIGDTLLLITDGMIERRDIPITEALDDFARRAAVPQPSAAALADHALSYAVSDTGDDACLVAVRIR
jgi:serine phosphatase RsbU (regulator of sigma subunit)